MASVPQQVSDDLDDLLEELSSLVQFFKGDISTHDFFSKWRACKLLESDKLYQKLQKTHEYTTTINMSCSRQLG